MILKILFYLLLVTIPLGVVFRFSPYLSVFIYPLDIVVLLISICYVSSFFKTRNAEYSEISKAFEAFVIFSFVSLLLNRTNLNLSTFFISFSYLARYIALFSVFLSTSLLDSKFKKKYLSYLSISVSVFAIAGLFQYIIYPDLRNLTYQGWDEHLYRLFSTLFDPNFAGAFLVMGLFLLVYKFQQTKSINRAIYAFTSLLTLIAIFLTYSRSSYIALIVASIFYLFYLGKKKLIFLFLLIFILGVFIIPHNFKSEGVNLFRTASVFARENSYKTALEIFKKNPLFGVGFNSFRYAQNKYGFLIDGKWQTTNAGAGVPNSYLLLLATTGIMGFILYFNFWRVLIKDLFKEKDKQLKALILAVLTALFVQSLFENILFYSFISCFVFVFCGILMKEE